MEYHWCPLVDLSSHPFGSIHHNPKREEADRSCHAAVDLSWRWKKDDTRKRKCEDDDVADRVVRMDAEAAVDARRRVKKTTRIKCKHVYLQLKLCFAARKLRVTETMLMDVLKASLRYQHGVRDAAEIDIVLVDFGKEEGTGIVRIYEVDYEKVRTTIERTDTFDGYACTFRIVRASHFLMSLATDRENE